MRTQLLSYLTANLTGTIKTSQELPFEQGGTSLYIRNLRRVYLDEPYIEQDILVNSLDESAEVNQQITYVRAYLAVDAKNRNSDLDSALATMSQALRQADITNSFRKEFDYTTTLDDDKIIYEFEYRYYQII
jgi:tRNA A37 N6-isopentenylltransferase MiaA